MTFHTLLVLVGAVTTILWTFNKWLGRLKTVKSGVSHPFGKNAVQLKCSQIKLIGEGTIRHLDMGRDIKFFSFHPKLFYVSDS